MSIISNLNIEDLKFIFIKIQLLRFKIKNEQINFKNLILTKINTIFRVILA